jgi:orotidine-5'-phosphate decarboxylase
MQLTQKEKLARDRVCLPLDGLNTIAELEQRVEELSPVVGWFKIGKESYTRFGPQLVDFIENHGSKLFLDLKYHDIPNTLQGAADAATQLSGVHMFNVHAQGGYEMMKKTMEGTMNAALKFNRYVPKVIAVTVLTSIDLLRYVHNNLSLIKGLEHIANDEKYYNFVSSLEKFPFTKFIDMEMERTMVLKLGGTYKWEKAFNKLKTLFENIVKQYDLEGLIPSAVRYYGNMAHQAGLDGIVCSAKENFEKVA